MITEVNKNTETKTEGREIVQNAVQDSPRTTLHFTNTIIDPIELKIPVQKILQGRSWKDSDKYAAGLVLHSSNPDAPMPKNTKLIGVSEKVSEVVIDNQDEAVEDGSKVIGYKDTFEPITYTIDDIDKTYNYRVHELTPSESSVDAIPGVSYDEKIFDVIVKITLDKTKPKNPKLVATATYKDDEGKSVTFSSFTNVYDAEETAYKMEAVKDFYDITTKNEIELDKNQFTFAVRPIGDNAAIAPMPEGTERSGSDRVFYKGNEDDGDIEFEQNPDGIKDGMVFNYKALIKAGVDDAALHSDEGVDFEYVLYEIIPGTPEGIAKGKTLTDNETLVNNENGTYSVIGDDYEIVYDGIHHTRKITVKVIAGEPMQTGKKHIVGGDEYDVLKDFNEVEYYVKEDNKAYKVEDNTLFAPNLETLDVEGHKDDHTACYYISEKSGTPKNVPMSDVEGYDPSKHHFKVNEHREEIEGAPIFINYRFKQQYVDLIVKKDWDDADDQDKIRPKSVMLTIESDEGDYKPAALEIKGSGNTWTASEKLPVWKFDANTLELSEIKYTVKEDPVPTGYTVSYNPEDASSITLDPSKKEFALTVTNKHVPGQGDIEGDETWGLKGQEQTGTPKYDVNPKNTVTPTGLVKPDKEGATISDDGKTVTIPGEGKYVLNNNGTITFTPENDYVGNPTPVNVKGTDKQGNEHEATYTPHVIDPKDEGKATRTIHYRKTSKTGEVAAEDKVQEVTLTRKATKVDPKNGNVLEWGDWAPATFPAVDNPIVDEWYTDDKVEALEVKEPGNTEQHVIYQKKPSAKEDVSYGLLGAAQKGLPPFTPGSKPFVKFKLIDPKTGEEVDTITVPGEGKYTVNPKTGEVTFEPEANFVGGATTVTVRATDENGNIANGRYTPHVVDPEDKVEVKRIIKFTYEKKDGTPVTDSITQIGTIIRKALEVDPKTGEVTKWGPWTSWTFPAVKNPDAEAGPEWATKDIAGELTVSEPQKEGDIPIEYIVYHKAEDEEDCPDCNKGVKTGDTANLLIWILLIALAAAATIILRRRRKYQ